MEFLDTFEQHAAITDIKTRDGRVTWDDFREY